MSAAACSHLGYIWSPIVMRCLLLLTCMCSVRAAGSLALGAAYPYWLPASLT